MNTIKEILHGNQLIVTTTVTLKVVREAMDSHGDQIVMWKHGRTYYVARVFQSGTTQHINEETNRRDADIAFRFLLESTAKM